MVGIKAKETLAQLMSRRWAKLVFFASIAIFFDLLGGGITWKMMQSSEPAPFLPGQQLAQTMAENIALDELVLNASGGYVSGAGIFLYTQLPADEAFAVRSWASSQLLFYDDEFATFPEGESLIWLIDYGANQETVRIPLGKVADPATYEYTSVTRNVQPETAGAPESAAAVELVETPVDSVSTGSESVLPDTAPVDQGPVEELSFASQAGGDVLADNTQFVNNFDDGFSPDWTAFGGSWEIIDGAYHQTEEQGYDFGTVFNFQGGDYSLSARVQYLGGEMGAGFYYNMMYPDSKAASQMFNFTQGGTAIQWGHFNEAGEFVFEDATPVPSVADGEWHTLQLNVQNGQSTIVLDGEIVAENLALTYDYGYVGLLASQSHVAFDDVLISQHSGLNSSEAVALERVYDFADGNVADWLAFAGEWTAVDGRYEQRQQTEWDRIAALNTRMVGTYRFSTEMLFIEGDMGGGLMFNMQQRDDKALSHMISFTGRGTFLQWGSFDASGVFVYQAGANIPNVSDGNWHELAVEVYETTYNILLDGVLVATDIPLVYNDGFVGLFDGQSWVAYDNVRLSGLAQSTAIGAEAAPAGEGATTPAPEDDATPEPEGETTPEPEGDGAVPPEATPPPDADGGDAGGGQP